MVVQSLRNVDSFYRDALLLPFSKRSSDATAVSEGLTQWRHAPEGIFHQATSISHLMYHCCTTRRHPAVFEGKTSNDFKYLNTHAPAEDMDFTGLADVQDAIRELGIEIEDEKDVFKALAGLLHLGQVRVT